MQDRVKQARSYLKSIFDEAIEQEFLVKDPTRKLKIPKNLRPKDKQILTWEQMRAILAKAARRDRLVLMLDMTDALRPSEFLLSAGSPSTTQNTLSIDRNRLPKATQALRKDPKEPRQDASSGWPVDRARTMEAGVQKPDPSPEAFIFPNANGGLIDTANYRCRVLKPRQRNWESKAELPDSAPDHGDPGAEDGVGEGHSGSSAAREADTTANEYMQELPDSVQEMVGSMYAMLKKGGGARRRRVEHLRQMLQSLSEERPVNC